MKTHFFHGCPWADGSIQQADTDQTYRWEYVTCQHCLSNRLPDESSRCWKAGDRQRYENFRKESKASILEAVANLRHILLISGYRYQGESLAHIEQDA